MILIQPSVVERLNRPELVVHLRQDPAVAVAFRLSTNKVIEHFVNLTF